MNRHSHMVNLNMVFLKINNRWLTEKYFSIALLHVHWKLLKSQLLSINWNALYLIINVGLILQGILFRTVPERNLCSDVKTKPFLGNVSKNVLPPHAKQWKMKKKIVYDSLEFWSLHYTVWRFEDASAV